MPPPRSGQGRGGSCRRMNCPTLSSAVGSSGAERMEPTQRAPALRVCIGEDDVLLREGIVRILLGAGIDVVAQSGDAEELLREVLAFRPDVAIFDVRMPPRHEDDGLVAALEVRR